MVEGDLLDLTLPSLLQALTREKSTAVLRLQRGTDDGADQGTVYFREGALGELWNGLLFAPTEGPRDKALGYF